MSSDTEKHHERLGALGHARGKGDDPLEPAVTAALVHVVHRAERANAPVSLRGRGAGEPDLKPEPSSETCLTVLRPESAAGRKAKQVKRWLADANRFSQSSILR